MMSIGWSQTQFLFGPLAFCLKPGVQTLQQLIVQLIKYQLEDLCCASQNWPCSEKRSIYILLLLFYWSVVVPWTSKLQVGKCQKDTPHQGLSETLGKEARGSGSGAVRLNLSKRSQNRYRVITTGMAGKRMLCSRGCEVMHSCPIYQIS